jgi:hypothetical protein
VMNERVDRITLNGRAVVLPICGVFEMRRPHPRLAGVLRPGACEGGLRGQRLREHPSPTMSEWSTTRTWRVASVP